MAWVIRGYGLGIRRIERQSACGGFKATHSVRGNRPIARILFWIIRLPKLNLGISSLFCLYLSCITSQDGVGETKIVFGFLDSFVRLEEKSLGSIICSRGHGPVTGENPIGPLAA